jgi:hypothetical protein
MKVRKHRTVWGYDPKWLRVEAFDHCGISLGIVYFEPNDELAARSRAAADRKASARETLAVRSSAVLIR